MSTVLELAERHFLGQEKLNVQIVDQVLYILNHGSGDEQRKANELLVRIKQDPDAWMKVDSILELSQSVESKYFALQLLENAVHTRWKALPVIQREGIRNFLVKHILELSANSATQSNQMLTVLLHKLNLVLVQIVKQEWPRNWPSFIHDIVSSSKADANICINNMNILSLLSEDVFDFGGQNLTQAKELYLKQHFCDQFRDVFQLCVEILEKCPSDSMVRATLTTLHRFLSWIPIGYVFESKIVSLLCQNFLSLESYRTITLQCLTEVASIRIEHTPERDDIYRDMFFLTLNELRNIIDFNNPNLEAAYINGSDTDQKFIHVLSLFLCTFLKEYISVVESVAPNFRILYDFALSIIVSASKVEDTEIFNICLDFWMFLASDLYRDSPFHSTGKRNALYNHYLSIIRDVMISRMAKPEEVLVVENDQGEVVREIIKDTDSINLYKNMKEALVYLCHLDVEDTQTIIVNKLTDQVQTMNFSWKKLNSLCWAIGSISGCMTVEQEKRFLVIVIRDLLGMVEHRRGKDNKAVIAANIMYVVGQYPRFLRAHWKFLKTVINKLFEFMHESHDGVQDMACDTFIKIAIKTKVQFVTLQTGEVVPFIEEIISKLQATICDLTPAQSHIFFEAIGQIISAESDENIQTTLITKAMNFPNSKWAAVVKSIHGDVQTLGNVEILREIINVIKINTALCIATGDMFAYQMSTIFIDMLSIYRILSSELSTAVSENGEGILKDHTFKLIRTVKKEFLVLLSTWIANTRDVDIVGNDIIPPLFEAVLLDYKTNVPGARDPKVLSLLSIICMQQGDEIRPHIPDILGAVFESTLEMINKDMEAWPEHRTNFFKLLMVLTEFALPVFLEMPEEQLKVVIDAVVWAFQHSMRNVAEIGLDILKCILTSLPELPDELSQPFYEKFYMSLLQHVLAVVADSSHVHVVGITYYAVILCELFKAPEYTIKVRLNKENPQQSNIDYVFGYIADLFSVHFTNLTGDQVRVLVKGFLSLNKDITAMKHHLRDFLVQIKEFIGEDTSDLFLEDREKELAAVQAAKSAVPGMCNPNEIVDEDMV